MPGFGLRLQLKPPECAALPWLRGLPAIQSISELHKPLGAYILHVGSGDALHKLGKSQLAPPYTDGVDGEPAYCLALYAKTVENSPEIQQQIKEQAMKQPRYSVLAVDAHPGQPSHAEIIGRWFAIFRHRTEDEEEAPQPKKPRVVPPRRLVPTKKRGTRLHGMAVVRHRNPPSSAETFPRASPERRPVACPRRPMQRSQAGRLAYLGAGTRLSRRAHRPSSLR